MVSISHFTGIDRSTLYQYQNGKRQPPSLSVVEKLCDCLQLNQNDRERMIDAFYVSRDGEYTYTARKQLADFLCQDHNNDFSMPVYKAGFPGEHPDVLPLAGRVNVEHGIEAVLMSSPEEEEVIITSLIVDECLSQQLKVMTSRYPNKKIRHLVMLDDQKRVIEGQSLYNLKLLAQLYPLMMNCVNYECYYAYGSIQTVDSSVFPVYNMIYTDRVLMIYATDLSYGNVTFNVSEDEDNRNRRLNSFSKAKPLNIRSRFADSPSVFAEVLGPMYRSGSKDAPVYYFEPDLCISMILDPEKDMPLLEPIISKVEGMDQKSINTYLDFCSKLKMNADSKAKNVTRFVFRKEGIEHFCRTGELSELYFTKDMPLPVSYRIDLLERWKKLVMTDHARMISLTEVYTGNPIGLSAKNDTVVIQETNDHFFNNLIIQEMSLVINVRDFLETAYEKEAESMENTLTFLNRRIAELKKQL